MDVGCFSSSWEPPAVEMDCAWFPPLIVVLLMMKRCSGFITLHLGSSPSGGDSAMSDCIVEISSIAVFSKLGISAAHTGGSPGIRRVVGRGGGLPDIGGGPCVQDSCW